MSTHDRTFVHSQHPTLAAALDVLGPESYTTHRLQHATPEHLHQTTRRCFVGPIPVGWLKSHRKAWYQHYLPTDTSSKALSFSADDNVGRHRRMTGVDLPIYHPSFPQPHDAAALDGAASERDSDLAERDEAGLEDPSALAVARAEPIPHDPTGDALEDAEHALSSYATAPSHLPASLSPDDMPKSSDRLLVRRKTSRSSYVTAHTDMDDSDSGGSVETFRIRSSETPHTTLLPAQDNTPSRKSRSSVRFDGTAETGSQEIRTSSAVESSANGNSLGIPATSASLRSTAPLLHNSAQFGNDGASPALSPPAVEAPRSDSNALTPRHISIDGSTARPKTDTMHSKVRFKVPESSARVTKAEMQVRARLAQAAGKRLPQNLTRGKLRGGEIVKIEKMLVRVDTTTSPERLADDFDEGKSNQVVTKTMQKWREYMVVCRETDDEKAALALQMYKTRVIPASTNRKTKKHWTYELLLDRARVRVNLYSSLDKTLVIWEPHKQATHIYLLRAQSGTASVEWYHLIREVLGLGRSRTLQINVPDLRVSLRLDNPFNHFDRAKLAQAAEGDEAAITQALEGAQAVAGRLVDRCLDMLSKTDEWTDILDQWTRNGRVGLAWKRYDRLEWVYGANEKKMYGTLAMQQTHELELRAKEHYPTTAKTHKGNIISEPAPVEGFLVRLTSQKGSDQKFGKLFYKRLYFTSQNQYLLFLRPAKATPPPPPRTPMTDTLKMPSAKQIADKIPLIYAVNPYPLHNGTISWLAPQDMPDEDIQQHDADAHDEAERNAGALLHCDGFIDLCDVVQVRKIHQGAAPADEQIADGSDVDFDAEVADTHHEDGATTSLDGDRTFELLMKNGLVVRLQAFDKATRKEWMRRLRELVKYWTYRLNADVALFKSVREQNLQSLNLDERTEALVGSFARKWEVMKSYASPELYNMCGISTCRSIHRSGMLFRKPRRHSTFTRCHVVLSHGHLVIFQDTMRTHTGKALQHIHHERIAAIDLADSYLYSGLATENDLLYQNRSFDATAPGNHALPRVFLEDGWTSTDEDPMTCFVVWSPQHKGWFRSSQHVDDVREGRHAGRHKTLKRVNQLGVKGRSIVFKARSRAERDHWVLGIATEIERLVHTEDVRVVDVDAGKGGPET